MKAPTLTMAYAILLTSLFAGCALVSFIPTKAGQSDIRLTAEITASGQGSPDFIVRLNPKSRTVFRGSVEPNGTAGPEGTDAYVMTVDQMHWFSNWHDGWTEADITTTGTLLISKNGTKWDVTVLSKLVPEQTTAAKIRYRDTIKRNDEAVALMNRRIERIAATVEWLAKRLPVDSFSGSDGIESFRKAAGTILFPELYGYPEGKTKSADIAANRNPGEGYRWDVAYTKGAFPEYMVDIRNTGTLFRDWEETNELIFFMYLQTK